MNDDNRAASILLSRKTGAVLVLSVLLAIFALLISKIFVDVSAVPEPTATPVQVTEAPVEATPEPVNENDGYVTGNGVMFRTAPSKDAATVGELHYGNELKILGREGEWVRAQFLGKEGYVFGEYVKNISERQDINGVAVAALAKAQTGIYYCWGGDNPEIGFDAPGLVSYVFAEEGITLNRTPADQAKNGVPVASADDAEPGDLVFFRHGDAIDHCGVYLGDGCIVHVENTNAGVRVSSLLSFGEDADEIIVRRVR